MDIFPPDLERRLAALAMATGRTRDAIVREAVTEYVDESGAVGTRPDRRVSGRDDTFHRPAAHRRERRGVARGSSVSRWDELMATGILQPPLETGDPFEDWPDIRLPPGTAAELIDEDRGDA